MRQWSIAAAGGGDLRTQLRTAATHATNEAAADLTLKGVKATEMSSARNIGRGVAALLSTTAEGLR